MRIYDAKRPFTSIFTPEIAGQKFLEFNDLREYRDLLNNLKRDYLDFYFIKYYSAKFKIRKLKRITF